MNDSNVHWSTDEPYFSYVPGLWPEEEAWKLSFELRRSKGHPKNEVSTFRNVPISSFEMTNRFGWTTNVGGITVTLDCFVQPVSNNRVSSAIESSVLLRHSVLPSNVYFEMVSVVSDAGESISFRPVEITHMKGDYWVADFPKGSKTADITFAVFPSRHVEFVVKPAIRTGIFELHRAQ